MSKFKRNPLLERFPQFWTKMWPESGKFWKRLLHKTRRQVAREEIKAELEEVDRIHQRHLPGIEGEVNYKGW